MGLDGDHLSGIPKSSSVLSEEEIPHWNYLMMDLGNLVGRGTVVGMLVVVGEGASGDCSGVRPGDVEFGGEGEGSMDVSEVVAGDVDCGSWESNGEGRVQDFAEN